MENQADSWGGGGRVDAPIEEGGEMSEFNAQVRQMKALMEQVAGEIREFVQRADEVKRIYKKDELRSLEEWIEKRTTELTQSLSRVRVQLQQMKDDYEKLPAGCAERRIRRNMHDILSRNFLEVMEEYSAAQNKHKQDVKSRAKRILTTFQGLSEEESEQIAENLNPALADMSALSSKDAIINHLQQRHEDILRLENSIRELYEMFNEFAVLVNSQQELLDNVGLNIDSAKTNLVEGNKNLKKAVEHQKKSRKCMCCIFILLTIVGAVVLVSVLSVSLSGS